jgi:fumarate reductase subunit C
LVDWPLKESSEVVSTAIAQARAWYWQRISAMVLMIHLGLILYAMRGGLTAGEILGRTQGNLGLTVFYTVFVLACVIHVPLGLQKIAEEWGGMKPSTAQLLTRGFAALILVLGLTAVWAVTAP